MIKKILKWLPAAFIAACSFYFSSKSHLEYMPSFWSADKVVHFFCYGGFAFWIAFACNIKNIKQIWLPVLIIALWGITDEIHQSFIPYRSASVFDWFFDTLGAVLGSIIYVLIGLRVFSFIQTHLPKLKKQLK